MENLLYASHCSMHMGHKADKSSALGTCLQWSLRSHRSVLSGHKTLIAFLAARPLFQAPPFPLRNYPSFWIQSVRTVARSGKPLSSPSQALFSCPGIWIFRKVAKRLQTVGTYTRSGSLTKLVRSSSYSDLQICQTLYPFMSIVL